MDLAQFKDDDKTQSAVILQLVVIGEMAKRISDETKNTIDLPWKEIAGFRDVAVHDYFSLDFEIVWQTVIDDIPVVKGSLQ